jgi:lysylphosphatidylglycerol synthetase-like protein (DUF2156 family)
VLPFLRATEEVTVSATGIQLMSGKPDHSGSLVHGSYAGEVDTVVRRAKGPAWVAFVVAIVGALLALFPGARWQWASLAVAGFLVLSLGALWQATSLQFVPADRRYGFWLAVALALSALGLTAARLRSYYGQWRA